MKRQLLSLALTAVLSIGVLPMAIHAKDTGWKTNLSGLTSTENKPAQMTEDANGMTLTKTSQNDGIALSKTVSDSEFVLESDVKFVDGNVANLVFGAQSSTTVENSFVFKFDRGNRNETKVFFFSESKGHYDAVSGNGNEYTMGQENYHLKVVVENDECKLYVGDVLVGSANLPDSYIPGYLGIGAAEGSTVTFQNTVYTSLIDKDAWKTNLDVLISAESSPAKFFRSENGMTVSRTTSNDGIAISKTKTAGDFTFESDVKFVDGNVANLVFGAESGTTAENSFIFKLDRHNKAETKIFCFSDSRGFPTVAENNGNEFPTGLESYHMKAVVQEGVCKVYVNDILVAFADLPDYYADGYLGIGAAEGSTVTFQNTVYTADEEGSDPGTPDPEPGVPSTGDSVLPVLLIVCFVAPALLFCVTKRKTAR